MALETERDILALADQLTASADTLHARLSRDLQTGQLDQPAAQALFQDETLLRQRADALYAEGARRVAAGLPQPQQELLAAVAAANGRIRGASSLGDLLAVAGDLLAFAAAVCAAKPEAIATALERLRRDLAG